MKMSYGKAPKKPAKPSGNPFAAPAAPPMGAGTRMAGGPGMAPPFPLKGMVPKPKAKKRR